MFKTILYSLFIFGSVISNPNNINLNDFGDREAYLLAQQWNHSLLDPPIDDFNRILKELTAIRKAFPAMADIHYNPVLVSGQLILKGIDLLKLNASEFGPIIVESIGSEQVLVTFGKSFNSIKVIESGNEFFERFGKKDVKFEEIGSVLALGYTTQVSIFAFNLFNQTKSLDDAGYFFENEPVDPYAINGITFKQHWMFTVKGDNVTYHPD